MDDDRQPHFLGEEPRSSALSPALDDGANALLLRYGAASSFFFASPRRTLLGEGLRVRLQWSRSDTRAQLQGFFEALRAEGSPSPVIVGAWPFDSEQAPVLYVPKQIARAGALQHDRLPPTRPAARHCTIHERPSAAEYAHGVEAAIARMNDSELRKVVLSRSLDIVSDTAIDQSQLLRNLARRNPSGYSFAVEMPVATRGCSPRRLMGASPELLLERRGNLVIANPIAGSIPRSRDAGEDLRRGTGLISSAKDRHEHELVVDAVLETLRPYCRAIECAGTPSVISTPSLWHLSTQVIGVLRDSATTSLEVARALHPTPAVCGEPRAMARDFIRETEPFPRGLFTGMVGWCDANGDGEWAVTIRCAEVEAGRARLFAGAGIVPASDPQLEVAETGAKFRAMLDALGVEHRA